MGTPVPSSFIAFSSTIFIVEVKVLMIYNYGEGFISAGGYSVLVRYHQLCGGKIHAFSVLPPLYW